MDEDGTERTIVFRPQLELAPMTAAMGHYLVHGEAEHRVRVEIAPPGMTIGRVPPADLVLANPSLSRSHCRIDLVDGWAIVTDLGSTNGTLVNDEPIAAPVRLRTGAALQLGMLTLTYERRDRRDVRQEAELARDIRRAVDYARAILPPPLTDGPVRADWYFAPCATLGGDIFGYRYIGGDTLTGYLLDVSGHGIGSAMHAIAVGNALRQGDLRGAGMADPGAVAAALNAMFPMEDHDGLLLTLWCWSYHAPSRVLRYAAAGHHPALLAAPGQPPRPLLARGPAIGMLPNGRWAVEQTIVPPGARLYVFSDGAFDIVDRAGVRWTEATVADLVASGAGASGGVTEPERLYRAAREATSPNTLPDDFSSVVLTIP